jgi:hypothetical protein
MPNPDTNHYIFKRLQAGDSPADIARALHARGYSTDTPESIAHRRTKYKLLNAFNYASQAVIFLLIVALGFAGASLLPEQPKSNRLSIESAEIGTVLGSSDFTDIALLSKSAAASDTAEVQTASASAETSALNEETTSKPVTEKASASSAARKIRKSEYKIAFIGDSMIDTLESHLPMLAEKLKQLYGAEFELYNYGVGAENVEQGLDRFNQSFEYKERSYPALSELEPDIIIIGSFAYNPFEKHDINKYWLTMARLIETAQQTGADVYLLAEVAPVKNEFGQGSLDWPLEIRTAQAERIVEQFNSFIALAETKNIPLIDAYTPSQDKDGFGNKEYVSDHDGIHASDTGKLLMLLQIVKTVRIK